MKIYFLIFVVFGAIEIHASEAVGFYSDGHLLSAQSVFEKGDPIHKLFVKRQRLYTTEEMHQTLTEAAEFIQSNFPNAEPLQVGDLSNKLGGVAIGHASHQNGLDGDIVYLRRNGYIQSADAEDWIEDFVNGNKPSSNFNLERNFALFNYLVSTAPVSRIFVDASLKKAMCDYAVKTGQMKKPLVVETLRRLRPQDLHRTHFHLRLDCPPNDHECTKQSAPADGSGCDDLSLIMEAAAMIHSC
jgi:penicillin-insensitive murein endopeptidase